MRHNDEEDDEGFKNVDDEFRDVFGKLAKIRRVSLAAQLARSRHYKAI